LIQKKRYKKKEPDDKLEMLRTAHAQPNYEYREHCQGQVSITDKLRTLMILSNLIIMPSLRYTDANHRKGKT